MVGDSEQPATEFMVYYFQQLKKVSDKSKNLEELFKKITSQIITHHFGAIVGLHNTNLLSVFLEQYAQRGANKMTEIAVIGYHSFFRHFNEYKNIFDSQNIKEISKNDQKMFQKYLGQDEQYQKQRELLKKWFSLKNADDKSQILFKRLNDFIKVEVQPIKPVDGFEQLLMIWLKRQMQDLQYILHQKCNINSDDLCCRLHFKKEEMLTNVNRQRNTFVSPTEKEKLVEHSAYYRTLLKKQIIAFLNERGGVINLGAKIDNKKYIISGLTLKPSEKKAILRFIVDICFQIQPQRERREESQTQSQYLSRLQQLKENLYNYLETPLEEVEYQYWINEYISVEFVPIYNSSTFLYSEGEKAKTHLLRIKVRPGDPYEVYYFINDKDTPESAIRDGKKTKQLLFLAYYQAFYSKLKMKSKGQVIIKETNHHHCRLDLREPKIEKKESGMSPIKQRN